MQAATVFMPRGPVMVDVAGHELTDLEIRRLMHPLVGGVILFRRNFSDVDQLRALTRRIRGLRSPALLVTVDHEGGRVQRFLAGFTRLPPMRRIGALWSHSPREAMTLARETGTVLAAELRASGVDLSFAPVLDLDWDRCPAIGDRALHRDPEVVTALGVMLIEGMASGGMASVGKHFPGHGWVDTDSHLAVPQDDRDRDTLWREDILPFRRLARAGFAAVIPSHVVYPAVDSHSAGFSRVWLQQVLRGELGFTGTIFTDDLSMEGAAGAGDIVARAQAAFDAGCDMAMVCNRPDLADQLLAALSAPVNPFLGARIQAMAGQGTPESWQAVLETQDFRDMAARVAGFAVPREALAGGPVIGEAH